MKEREDGLAKRHVFVLCTEITASECLTLYVEFHAEESDSMSNVKCHRKHCKDVKLQ